MLKQDCHVEPMYLVILCLERNKQKKNKIKTRERKTSSWIIQAETNIGEKLKEEWRTDSRRKSNKDRGKWEAVKIGYSHVLHLRAVATDCRNFQNLPGGDIAGVRRVRRVTPSNVEGTQRYHVERHRGSARLSTGRTRRTKKRVHRGGRRRRRKRTHSVRSIPRRHRRAFWKFHEVHADRGELFIRAGHFAFLRRD